MKRYRPPAKINLGLRITGIRENRFHELFSPVFPLYGLHDILEISPSSFDGLTLECKKINENNILTKVYNIYSEAVNFRPNLYLKLIKNIPVGSGLGGGSSDAATFLLYLNSISPSPLSQKDLADLAFQIGADVPFFLTGKPALMTGAGERIEIIKGKIPEINLVLICPEIHISTVWAFRNYDEMCCHDRDNAGKDLTNPSLRDTQSFLLENPKLEDIISNIYNDLEKPVLRHYPFLARIKEEFLAHKALAAAMSGSGSSMYGIFSSRDDAEKACKTLRKKYNRIYQFSV